MHALATRPGRLALGIAVLTAAALGTVSASAAQASGTKTAEAPATATSVVHTKAGHGEAGHGKAGHGKAGNTIAGYSTAGHRKPPKGAGFGVAYRPTADAPDDVNAANDAFAACMRGHGQSVFPDIHASKDAK